MMAMMLDQNKKNYRALRRVTMLYKSELKDDTENKLSDIMMR